MKDFYDVWFLASRFPFDFTTVRTALEKSLSRRGVWPVAETPAALTPAFPESPARQSLWKGFLKRTRLEGKAPSFPDACAVVRAFLLPVLFPTGARPAEWTPGKGWSS